MKIKKILTLGFLGASFLVANQAMADLWFTNETNDAIQVSSDNSIINSLAGGSIASHQSKHIQGSWSLVHAVTAGKPFSLNFTGSSYKKTASIVAEDNDAKIQAISGDYVVYVVSDSSSTVAAPGTIIPENSTIKISAPSSH